MPHPAAGLRTLATLMWKAVRHPRNTLSRLGLLTPYNLKLLIHLLRTNDTRVLSARLHHYLTPHAEPGSFQALRLYDAPDDGDVLRFPTEPDPLVSIIVPAFNQWPHTRRCLRSILGAGSATPYEVIVADDHSSDETRAIATAVENVTLIRQSTNLGFLRNCNAAARHARGRYVVFLNNDTVVQPGWLDALVAAMEGDPRLGLVGSKLLFEDGRLQEAGGVIWKDGHGWNYGRGDAAGRPPYGYAKEVDYVSGASMMIRKAVWNALGGFDERFAPAYYEDVDLAFQVRAGGHSVSYQPRSVVVHAEGASHGTDPASGLKRHQAVNREKFVEKWAATLETEHFAPGTQPFHARDRSASKPTVLVIDHYVPRFDKDAGSRMTFLYLRLFVEMGFNVKFHPDDRVPHEPYTSALQALGVEVLHEPLQPWLEEFGHHLDVALLSRPHVASKHIAAVQRHTRAKILYLGHDLHAMREQRRYEVTGDRAALRSARHWRAVEGRLFKASALTLTVSDHETRAIQQGFPGTAVTTVPIFYYDESPMPIADFASRRGLLFVGGFDHPPNLDGITWFIREVLPRVRSRIPDMTLTIVGSNPPEGLRRLQSDQVAITGFVSDDELARRYDAARMVVVPLRYGAGMKGKTVEALHLGVPLVSTGNGLEGLPGIDALCRPQDDPAGFADEVIRLYGDHEALVRSSEASRRYVQAHFSRAAARSVWERVLSR